MADLFISYSREDSARAGQVAQGMIAAGFDVFWDTDVPPGQTWADYIEEKLANCAAVIVLWSQHSTKSQWVREEARMGRERGKLIPASLDDSIPPFGFGEVQVANISTWNGEMQGHAAWDRLVGAVQNAVARARGGEVSPPRAPGPGPSAGQAVSPPPVMPAAPRTVAPPPAAPTAAPPPNYGAAPPPQSAGPNKNMIIALAIGGAVLLGVGGYFAYQQFNRPPAYAGGYGAMAPGGAQPGAGPIGAMPGGAMPGAAPAAPGSVDYQAQMRQRLAASNAQWAAQGFRPVMAPFEGSLASGATQQYPISLSVGEYRVVGFCDSDCTDLDLSVHETTGETVAQDTAVDPNPVVPLTQQVSASGYVQVTMYSCSVEPCFYSVVVYGR